MTTKSDAAASLNFISKNMIPIVNGSHSPSIFLGGGELSKFTAAAWPSYSDLTNDASRFYFELFNTGTTVNALAIKSTPAPVSATSTIMLTTASPSTYVTYTSPITASGINTTLLDINLYSWINQSTGGIFAGIMQKIYLIHDLFLPNNWSSFKGGNDVYLQGFNMTGTCIKKIKLVATAPTGPGAYDVLSGTVPSGTAIPYVLVSELSILGGESFPLLAMTTVSNLNTFIIRRLFYLWIRMANYRIAAASNADETVTHACYLLLSRANDNAANTSTSDASATVSGEIYAGLADKQKVMRNAAGLLNDLNSDMATYQTTAQQAKNSITTEQSFERKVRIVEYVTFGILVAVFMASGFLTSAIGMEREKKLKMSLAVFLISSFSVAVIVLVYQSKIMNVEGFATPLPAAGTAYSSVAADAGFTTNVCTYLAATISLSSTLDSYDLATNINQAMFNDTVKYTNLNVDLQIAGRRLNDMAKIVDVEKAQHNSAVYLLLTLIMVLAVMLPLYIWAEDSPTIRMGVMVISGAVVFMALLVHAYESTSIVRTDGHKKYWGQPAVFAQT